MATTVTSATPVSVESPRRRAWRRLKKRKGAVIGLCVITCLVLLAIFAPLIAPFDPTQQSWSLVRKAPSSSHWFGTDEVGRDLLSRVIYGTRASLAAGVVSVGIAIALGVPLGMVAGYGPGWLDAVISRITDAMLACPFLILAIALAAFLGPEPHQRDDRDWHHRNADLHPADAWTGALGEGGGLRRKSARAIGNPRWRIALKHILPNVMPQLLVQMTLTVATAVIAEASLSFLGLGQQPPAPSWGSMLNSAQRFLGNAPWMAVWPGIAIFITVLSFNLTGDGLRDAFDPRELG